MFKGGTGTYLRAVTIRECVESARRAKRPIRMQVEIIDPANELLCHEYTQYRSSLTPGRTAPAKRGPRSAPARRRSRPSSPPAGTGSGSRSC